MADNNLNDKQAALKRLEQTYRTIQRTENFLKRELERYAKYSSDYTSEEVEAYKQTTAELERRLDKLKNQASQRQTEIENGQIQPTLLSDVENITQFEELIRQTEDFLNYDAQYRQQWASDMTKKELAQEEAAAQKMAQNLNEFRDYVAAQKEKLQLQSQSNANGNQHKGLDATTVSKTVLIIDDELSIREFVSDFLNEEGYNTLTAQNGLEGIELVKKAKPNLILVDTVMPVMNGIEFLRAYQELAGAKSPVIVLSARENITYDNKVGTVMFLAKPFDLEMLLETVNSCFKDNVVRNLK